MPTEDGWEPSPRIEPNDPILVWKQVPGSDVTIQVRNDDIGTLMLAYAADYHAYVEPLRDRETACYTPTNEVSTSNHLNATAMDFDWGSYPWKVRGNLVGDKLQRLRDLLRFYAPWMFWAGDWDDAYVDEMHHQANYGSYDLAQQGKLRTWVQNNIRSDGFSLYKRTPAQPTPTPVPSPPPVDVHPREASIQALYEAVEEFSMDDARKWVDEIMTGLAFSQCDNVKRIAMWLAQIGYESGDFVYTEEINKNGRYAPYIGRTWIQITWQSNYADFGKWCENQGLVDDPDTFVNTPASLADPKWAAIGPAWYWTVARPTINAMCDAGDLVGVTKAINGGTNGLTGVPNNRTDRYNHAIAVGDELLNLVVPQQQPTPQPGGPLMALTDDEQRELLQGVRDIKAQLFGDWPQNGNDAKAAADLDSRKASGDRLTLNDIACWLKNHVSTHKSPTP